MNRRRREVLADLLVLVGAAALFASLFLTWSHQFSAAFLAAWGSSEQLQGVPHHPSAWQVYSAADVVMAVLALGLVAVALRGGPRARLVAGAAVIVMLVFVVHALGHPPTNGANIFDPTLSPPGYAPNSPTSGPGEVVAVSALGLSLVGLVLSFRVD